MSVLVNVITPQGLEPFQFPTKIRSPSGGLRRDVVEAYKWVNLAASRADGEQQIRFAAMRDQLMPDMSRSEIAEGQRRAREWTPTPEP